MSRRQIFSAVPAWAISLVVHVIVLLAMSLIVSDGREVGRPAAIISSAVDEEEISEEISELEMEDFSSEVDAEPSEPVVEMSAAPEVVMEQVVPVEVAMTVDDIDVTSPAAIDVADFAADLSSAPAAANMGGGLGGRGNPGSMAARGGGGADTEAAVDRALKWLAAHQLPDGGWSFDLNACPDCKGKCSGSGMEVKEVRAGATALALLPFLGRGYTHRQGPYKKQVAAGISFLVQRAIEGQGRVYSDFEAAPGRGEPQNKKPFYSQGLAGIALAECYAMSRDDDLAAPTQAVLDFIMKGQDASGGGWRYLPGQRGDTSSVAWQLMALKSGHLAGLQVDPRVVRNVGRFLDSVALDESGSSYTYMVGRRDFKSSCTAAALLCRMFLDWKKGHPGLEEGVARIARGGPIADLYYTYYATQVLHHLGGEPWIAWNAGMKSLLLKSQATEGHEAGSWYDGFKVHHDYVAGRLYCTAMATMILEVYYRHLPLYGSKTVDERFGN